MAICYATDCVLHLGTNVWHNNMRPPLTQLGDEDIPLAYVLAPRLRNVSQHERGEKGPHPAKQADTAGNPVATNLGSPIAQAGRLFSLTSLVPYFNGK